MEAKENSKEFRCHSKADIQNLAIYWLKGCWLYSTSTKQRHLVGRSNSSSIMLIAISASKNVSLIMICSEIGPNWEDKFNYGLARFRSRTLNFLVWKLTLDCCVSNYNSQIKWKQYIKTFSRVTARNNFYQILTKKFSNKNFWNFFSSLNFLLSEPSKQKISGKTKFNHFWGKWGSLRIFSRGCPGSAGL